MPDQDPPVAPVAKVEISPEAYAADLDKQILAAEAKLSKLDGRSVLGKITADSLNRLINLRHTVYQTTSATPLAQPTNTDPPGAKVVADCLKIQIKAVFTGLDFDKTEPYLAKLNQIYRSQVAKSPAKTQLEAYFMSLIQASYVGPGVFKKIEDQNESVDTFEDFCAFIRKHYLPKENCLQVSSKIHEVEWDSKKEKLDVAAQEIDRRAMTAYATFKAQWDERENAPAMTPEDVFKYFGAVHLFNQLKQKEQAICRAMVKDLDKITTAGELASKAEYFRDRNPDFAGEVLYTSGPNRNYKGRKWSRTGKNKGEKAPPQEPKKESKPKAKPKGKADVLTIKASSPSSPNWIPDRQGSAPQGRDSLSKSQDFQ